MCNLSKGVAEQGRIEGIQEGIQEGIRAMVSTLKELQISDDIILNKVKEKFHLSEDVAKEYMEKDET